MCGGPITIRPDAVLGLHWHPNGNQWNYVLSGRAEATLYGARPRAGGGVRTRRRGTEPLAVVQVWDSDRFEEITLAGLFASVPSKLLAATVPGLPPATLARLRVRSDD